MTNLPTSFSCDEHLVVGILHGTCYIANSIQCENRDRKDVEDPSGIRQSQYAFQRFQTGCDPGDTPG